ncbi:hypothetical protein [Paenibacillus herberti]|uniref:hypothetical protein n=1 Tax=Paenibacillus herberti TaxID=1619309 RepID=UPI00159569FD|nr:hypothetical protein [Paenibacillus herberti]
MQLRESAARALEVGEEATLQLERSRLMLKPTQLKVAPSVGCPSMIAGEAVMHFKPT